MEISSDDPLSGVGTHIGDAMNEVLSTTVEVLLGLAIQAHVQHWTEQSGYRHTVLGELYGYAHEAADRLVEPSIVAIGFGPEGLKAQQGVELVQAIQALRDLQDEAELQAPWLANIAQELQAALYVYRFKLEKLK